MADRQVSIKNEEDLRSWLEGKPAEFAQVIALRVALRVVPVTGELFSLPDEVYTERQQKNLIHSVFRATFISWVARAYPAQKIRARALRASAAALKAATDVNTYAAAPASAVRAAAAASAARAAASAARAAASGDAADATARAAVSAARTAAKAADTIAGAVDDSRNLWKTVEADVRWLDKNDSAADPRALADRLTKIQLWTPVDITGGPPEWANSAWSKWRQDSLIAAYGFGIWGPWYVRRLTGGEGGIAPDLVGEAGEQLDIELATKPGEWWDRDPKEVNDDIKDMIDQARTGWHDPNDDPGPEIDTDYGVSDDFDDDETAPIEPPAGPGPQYQIRDGKLSELGSPPSADELGPQQALHRNLARMASGLALELVRVGNRYPALANSAKEYAELLRSDVADLDVVGLWSVGSSLAAFAEAYREQNVARTLEDPLEPQVAAQLQSLVRQHGAFILGFSEGRDLVERADEFALDRNRLAEIQIPGDLLLNELTENRDLVDDRTRELHRPVRDALGELGWEGARRGYAGYLIVRNGTRGLVKFLIGSEISVSSVLGILAGGSLIAGDPNMEAIRAMLPYFRDHAQNLLVFFNHSPEMRAYVEWALHVLRIDNGLDSDEGR